MNKKELIALSLKNFRKSDILAMISEVEFSDNLPDGAMKNFRVAVNDHREVYCSHPGGQWVNEFHPADGDTSYKVMTFADEKEVMKLPDIVNGHVIDKIWLRPQAQRDGITDSLLLESGVEIFSVKIDGKYDVFMRTCGDVRIVWKGESYRNRASFPDDLVEAIRNNNFYHNPDAYVDMNNWFEIFVYDEKNRLLWSDVWDDDITSLDEDKVMEDAVEELELALK